MSNRTLLPAPATTPAECPELYTDGHALLFRRRRKTALPPDAPTAYAKSQLGANTLAYMKARGWIDRRIVQRLADVRPAEVG
jgi:hypothetical protein